MPAPAQGRDQTKARSLSRAGSGDPILAPMVKSSSGFIRKSNELMRARPLLWGLAWSAVTFVILNGVYLLTASNPPEALVFAAIGTAWIAIILYVVWRKDRSAQKRRTP